MKKTILGCFLFLFVCAGSVLFFSSFKTATQNENLIFVQVFESFTPTTTARIVVSDGKTIIRTIALEQTKDKAIESNLLKIATTLNEIRNDGYAIIASNSNAANHIVSFSVTTYVFEKK